MIVNSDRQHFLDRHLANHILVKLLDHLARSGNFFERLLRRAPTALFLFKYRLAKIDTFATNVNVTWTFDQGPHVPIALAAERTKRILLGRAAATSISARFLRGHGYSFLGSQVLPLPVPAALWV